MTQKEFAFICALFAVVLAVVLAPTIAETYTFRDCKSTGEVRWNRRMDRQVVCPGGDRHWLRA